MSGRVNHFRNLDFNNKVETSSVITSHPPLNHVRGSNWKAPVIKLIWNTSYSFILLNRHRQAAVNWRVTEFVLMIAAVSM